MSTWRVTAWDRTLARGAIASALGTLPFDAAVAMTDDFRIGEAVQVGLRRAGASYVVTRIAPVDWHAPHAPRPAPDHQVALAEISEAIRDRTLRLRGVVDEVLTIDIEPESYEVPRSVVIDICRFVHMPTELRDAAAVSAYACADFARECPEIAKHWPALDPAFTVFRFEPRAFGEAAGYVVARAIRVGPSPGPA